MASTNDLDAFIEYNLREGMITRKPSYDELFAEGALDT